MAVTGEALADELAGEHVEGGEQRGRAVALVVVGDGPGAALVHRQALLGAVEGLDLGLLVEAEHDGPVGGVHVEADDVDQLVFEVRVVETLKVLTRWGLIPRAFHSRCTVVRDRPQCSAMVRFDQCVASGGVVCEVSPIIWSICSWVITGFRPRPSCTSPTQSTPSVSKCSATAAPSTVRRRVPRRCAVGHAVAGHQQALGFSHRPVRQRDARCDTFELVRSFLLSCSGGAGGRAMGPVYTYRASIYVSLH